MNTVKNRGGTSGSINKQLVTVDIVVLGGNSYFDPSLTNKIGGVVNYGVCACDRPEGV